MKNFLKFLLALLLICAGICAGLYFFNRFRAKRGDFDDLDDFDDDYDDDFSDDEDEKNYVKVDAAAEDTAPQEA